MKRMILLPAILAVLAVLSAFPAAFATHSRHYNGSVSGTFTLTSQTTASISGTGHETHLGKVVFAATSTMTGQSECGGFNAKEQVTTTAANGDKLFESANDVFCPTSDPHMFQLTASSTITGGTGRFSDASGSTTAHVTVAQTSMTGGTFSGTFTGTITY
jgi:hypothetical protein